MACLIRKGAWYALAYSNGHILVACAELVGVRGLGLVSEKSNALCFSPTTQLFKLSLWSIFPVHNYNGVVVNTVPQQQAFPPPPSTMESPVPYLSEQGQGQGFSYRVEHHLCL